MVEHLRAAGARTIALDFEYIQRTKESEDLELVEAINRAHGKVVLATVKVSTTGGTKIFGDGSVLQEIGARPAEVRLDRSTPTASSGVWPTNTVTCGAFPLSSPKRRADVRFPRSRFENGMIPIDFVGPPESFTTISYTAVMLGHFRPGRSAARR